MERISTTFQPMWQQKVISVREESVFFRLSLGVSQEEVQKRPQLGATQ
jgi:hypothetical protein